MSDHDGSKTKIIQENNPNTLDKKLSYLKLVVSNPPPVQKKASARTVHSNTGFTAEIRKRGHSYYVLIARDSSHYLDCQIILEIHNNQGEEEWEPGSVVCHFPNMLAEELDAFVGEDETLYAMVLIQFQMKILKQMLLFCEDHGALNLIIHADDTPEGHALGVYQSWVIYEDKIPTATGTKTQMVIPVTQETFDKWTDLTNQANRDFRQVLWEDQRTNPAIRSYLKANPCLEFFG